MNLLSSHWPISPTKLRLAFALFFTGYCGLLPAQCTLSCNSGLQVSLNNSGQALITIPMIAPNASTSCPGPLELKLFNNLGQQLPNPLLCEHAGQPITAQVRHLASGNFCTADLEVYDAISPSISCPDVYIFCHQDPSPLETGYPTASDNCSPAGTLDFGYLDSETDLGCGGSQNGIPVLKRIDRSWAVSDEQGNSNTCVQKIWIKHIRPADVVYPPNRDNIGSPALQCGQDPNDLELTGEPTVAGIPVGVSIDCEIAVTYSDNVVPACSPAAFTVLRTWTTIDFCSGTVGSRVQLIKVEDKTPPELVPPADLTIGTDGFTCSGSVTLPQAISSDNCSPVTVVPHWVYGNGYGPYTGIPLGDHVITYTATDACGNTASATVTLTVEDTSPPQAICSSGFQLSLSAGGVGQLFANSIASNSSDNCGPVFLAASRDAENYNTQLTFNCSDIGAPIPVSVRVRDVVGLENFCETEVTVRDFIKPNIVCPPNVSMNCLQDPYNFSLVGQAFGSDNCQLQSIIYQDAGSLDACHTGALTRTWKAIDVSGNLKTCSQTIQITPVNNVTVQFPADFQQLACASAADLQPEVTGTPAISGTPCSPLSVQFQDEQFSGIGLFCKRILRHWKIVDHCIYNPNGGTAGIWEHMQIIDVKDQIPPKIELPGELTFNADLPDCSAAVTLGDAIAVDCSAIASIDNNGAFAVSPGANASGIYPLGVHQVLFSATDVCGNTGTAVLRLTIADQTAPVALCRSGITVNIGQGGSATVSAQEINDGSFDHCAPAGDLQFSVAPTVFYCAQLGAQPVTLTVTDTSGNAGQCTVAVQVTDESFVCNIGGPSGYQIDGTIRTATGAPVSRIPVQITRHGTVETMDADTLGRYLFQDITAGDSCRIKPVNNANWLNGVTTFDLVLMSKHILGITPLDSPLKMIAADANRSNSITTFDIVQLRKILLGILDTVPGNSSWRFIDSTFVFPDTLNPFSSAWPEEITLNNLQSRQSGKNFIALKVGDVNHSTDPANARNPVETLLFDTDTSTLVTGQKYRIPVRLPRWSELEGFQFELALRSDLVDWLGWSFPHPELLNENHAAAGPGGRISVSWNIAGIAPAGDGVLFLADIVCRKTCKAADALPVVSGRLVNEAYGADGTLFGLAWRDQEQASNSSAQSLHIIPNPAGERCDVQLSGANSPGRLRVWNQWGVLVAENDVKGGGSYSLPVAAWNPGIYVVEWSDENRKVCEKLAVVRH